MLRKRFRQVPSRANTAQGSPLVITRASAPKTCACAFAGPAFRYRAIRGRTFNCRQTVLKQENKS